MKYSIWLAIAPRTRRSAFPARSSPFAAFAKMRFVSSPYEGRRTFIKRPADFDSGRAFVRVDIDLPIVLVEMSHSRQPQILHGHATSLSEGGMGVVIEHRLAHPR